MSWKVWAIIGAAGACAGYELLKYTVSTRTAFVFVGLLVTIWIALALFYRRRLSRLRRRFSMLSPEDQRRVLGEIDPGVAVDLQKGKKNG